MPYREPDESSALAKSAAADLARLADVGRLHKLARDEAQAHADASIEALARTPSSSMFRTRFEPSPFRLYAGLILGFSLGFSILSLALAGSGGEIAWGILMSITTFSWVVGAPIGWVAQLVRKRAHARRVLVWHADLPFAFPTFVSVLASKGVLIEGALRITLDPQSDVVTDSVVTGLLGLTSLPNVAVVVEGRTITIGPGVRDPALGTWAREVVEKVVLPIHAAHAIAEVELTATVLGT